MDASALESKILSLESSSGSLDNWLTFWIVLVVIGVVVEILAVALEHRSEVRDFRRGTIHTPDKPKFGMLVLNLLGASLVALGVTGEFAIHIHAASIETNLRDANMQLNVLFETQAAEANLKTEQLRARILRVFGPRDLSQKQLDRMTSRFATFAGVKIDVYGIGVGNPYNKSESDESIRIAKQLVGALVAARVDASGWVLGNESCDEVFGGSNVMVIIDLVPQDTRFAAEILKILEPEIDTFPKVVPQSVEGDCVRPLSAKAKDKKPSHGLGIVVGRKIPSLLTPAIVGIEESPK